MLNDKTFKGNFQSNIFFNNPIIVQVLGICSTLAVTNKISNTLTMTAAVIFITGFSNLTVSLLRHGIPAKVRMIIQTLIIASYTVAISIFLKVYMPSMANALGSYVGLIVTNCILMGRAEAFAMSHPPIISFWDGITSGLGYMLVLLLVALIREPLGFGTIMDFSIFGEGFVQWSIMISPASAFFVLALIIWIFRHWMSKKGFLQSS